MILQARCSRRWNACLVMHRFQFRSPCTLADGKRNASGSQPCPWKGHWLLLPCRGRSCIQQWSSRASCPGIGTCRATVFLLTCSMSMAGTPAESGPKCCSQRKRQCIMHEPRSATVSCNSAATAAHGAPSWHSTLSKCTI